MIRTLVSFVSSLLAVFGCLLLFVPFASVHGQPVEAGQSVEFYEFVFVEFGGRPGHESYHPKQDAPAPGQQATIRVKIFGPVQSARVEFVGTGGKVLASVPLSLPPGATQSGPEFIGAVVVPSEPFLVRAKGLDSSGRAFAVTLPGDPLTTPRPLQIEVISLSSLLAEGTAAHFYVRLVNYGAPDTFILSAFDTPSSALVLSPPAITLASQQSAIAEIATIVPPNPDPAGRFTLRVDAIGVATRIANSASLTVELAEHPGQPLVVEFKPGSCEAPINTKSRGVTPVAIMASAEFDPTNIDPRSIYVAGNVAPVRASIQDVGSPRRATDCGSSAPDGRNDLMLFFDTQQLVDAINSMMAGIAQSQKARLWIPLSARTKDNIEGIGFGTIRLQH
jgi:hypothetical protein